MTLLNVMKEKLQKIASSPALTAVVLDSDKGRFHDWEYTDYEADRERDEKGNEQIMARLRFRFDAAVAALRDMIGQAEIIEHEWNEQRPAWTTLSLGTVATLTTRRPNR